MTKRKMNENQQAAFDYAMNMGDGESLILNAAPGSGKTFVLTEILNAKSHQKGLFVAFMNKVVEVARSKITENHDVMTLNSFGMQTISKYWIDNGVKENREYRTIDPDKEKKLISEYFWMQLDENQKKVHDKWKMLEWEELEALSSAACLCKGKMLSHDDPIGIFETLIMYEKCEESAAERVIPAIQYALEQSIVWIEKHHSASLEDQIWAPIVMRMEPFEQYELIAVDEVQDFNRAKIELLRILGVPGANFIMAGDKDQSIMMFTSSSIHSYGIIKDMMRAKEFRLSVSYRFGDNVAQKVRNINPDIVGMGSTNIYETATIPLSALGNDTAILVRFNIQLMIIGIQFMLRGIPFRAKSENRLETRLKSLVWGLSGYARETYGIKYPDVDTIMSQATIDGYLQQEMGKLQAKKLPPDLISAKKELIKCLETVVGNDKRVKVNTRVLEAKIKNFFAGDVGTLITTAHSAKGLEFPTIIVPELDSFNSKSSDTYVTREGNKNVLFVAMTRCINNMYISKTTDVQGGAV